MRELRCCISASMELSIRTEMSWIIFISRVSTNRNSYKESLVSDYKCNKSTSLVWSPLKRIKQTVTIKFLSKLIRVWMDKYESKKKLVTSSKKKVMYHLDRDEDERSLATSSWNLNLNHHPSGGTLARSLNTKKTKNKTSQQSYTHNNKQSLLKFHIIPHLF